MSAGAGGRFARFVCSALGHRVGHDFKGRPLCDRCGLRFRIESPAILAHELRMRAPRPNGLDRGQG